MQSEAPEKRATKVYIKKMGDQPLHIVRKKTLSSSDMSRSTSAIEKKVTSKTFTLVLIGVIERMLRNN